MTDEHDPDLELFRAEVSDVRPLHHDRAEPAPTRPEPVPAQRLADEAAVLRELLADPQDHHELGAEAGEALAYLQEGVQRRVLRRLGRGQYALASELDLHGMTVALAKQELDAFLAGCQDRGRRCVRIIHGKGRGSGNRGPVLKAKVALWLRRRDDVLAFCSARPVDGGTGALYVLLRPVRGG